MTKMEGTAREAVKTRRVRYTPEENDMLFEYWWDPMKRRELPRLVGRNLTALRSQFCRLLKEKGISNDDYYRLMGEKHGCAGSGRNALRQRIRADNEKDEIILRIFAKHHALGNTKTKACEELRRVLGIETNNSALKLRFYRLMNKRGLTNQDLMEIGRQVLAQGAGQHAETPAAEPAESPGQPPAVETAEPPDKSPADGRLSDLGILSHLANLPREMAETRRRLAALEESQRHQLDLRGFIEHLLAVERDLKEEDRLRAEIQNLYEQNHQLSQELAAERKRMRAREEELTDVYQMVNTVLSEFMQLESVAKLATLGDFIHRLEVTVDQFGNVLKCRRV
ncbi:MAG: hypothetical protein ACM3XS_06515 [Bacteroidota bacterium]